MNQSECCHHWAHGRDRRCGNVFAESGVLYSYGHHFPIAERLSRGLDRAYLVNPAGYSATTNKHQSCAMRAMNGRARGVVGSHRPCLGFRDCLTHTTRAPTGPGGFPTPARPRGPGATTRGIEQ